MTHPTITPSMPVRHKILLGVFFAFSGLAFLLGLIIVFVDPDNTGRDVTADSAAG